QQRSDEVIDVDEGPRLLAGALNGEIHHTTRLPFRRLLHAQHELRNDMFAPHVGPVDVVWPADERPIEEFPAVVHGKQLADDLSTAIREARVQYVRNGQR